MFSAFHLFWLPAAVVLSVAGAGSRSLAAPPIRTGAARAAGARPLGEMMPDVPLRDQDGGEIRLRDFRGKALAITFFYSRCTAAAFCPLVGRNFDATQALLLRMGAAERCHLLSISLDPKRDTPEMLSAYARGYQADAVVWSFATGRVEDIQQLGDAVGLECQRVGDRIDHNLRTVVVDAGGRIRHIFRGDSWTPQELAAELSATARRYH